MVGQGAIVGDGPDFDRPNKKEPNRLNTGITVVGKRAVIPRGARIGRNVKVASTCVRRTSEPASCAVEIRRGRRGPAPKRGHQPERGDSRGHGCQPAERRDRGWRRAGQGVRPDSLSRIGPVRPDFRRNAIRRTRRASGAPGRRRGVAGRSGRRAARARRSGFRHQLGPRPRRPSPLRPVGHPHPRSIPRVDLLGTTRHRSMTCSASRTGACCAGTTSFHSPSSRSARTSGRCWPSNCRRRRWPTVGTRSGWRLRGSWGSPTRSSTSRPTGCGSAARSRTSPRAARGASRSLPGTQRRCPSFGGRHGANADVPGVEVSA